MGTTKNRNAQRSIKLLEEAFTSLLTTKPYEKITVSDITRKADLNRGTFYAHFDSVDDLMRQTMDDVTEKISASFSSSISDKSFIEDPMPFLTKIGEFLTENLALIKRLVASNRLEPLFAALFERLTEMLHERAQKMYPENGTLSLKVADFIVGGVIDVYGDWLKGDYGSESIEQVNQDLCMLIKAAGTTFEPAKS